MSPDVNDYIMSEKLKQDETEQVIRRLIVKHLSPKLRKVLVEA